MVQRKNGKSSSSGKTAKTNVRTTQNNIMSKADEILGGGQASGNQNINIRTSNKPGSGSGANSGGFMDKIKSAPAIKGAASLVGKYGISTLGAIGKGTLRTASTVVGTMTGAAGAIAKGGDVSDVFKAAMAGGAMGNGLVNSGINFASNLGKKIQNVGNDIQDTYNEGAYGAEYAQNIKMVREFKQTSDYKELRKKYGDELTDEKLSEILKAAKEEQEKSKKK